MEKYCIKPRVTRDGEEIGLTLITLLKSSKKLWVRKKLIPDLCGKLFIFDVDQKF